MDDEWFEKLYFRLLSFCDKVDGRYLIRVKKLRYVLGSSFYVCDQLKGQVVEELVGRGWLCVYNKFYYEVKKNF